MTITTEAPVRMGAVGRARLSVAAVEALAAIRREGRTVATDGERATLAGWSGWGPLAPAFAPADQTWADLAERLAGALPEDDLDLGMQGTYNAYYTPEPIAAAMWQMLTALGFTGGQVLEPGCGGGAFMRTAPAGARMVGVERDTTAADICRLLNPGAQVITGEFQATRLRGGYAAAIGNVPFGDVSVHDANAPDTVTGSLHDYFIWRAVDLLAPGGVAVLLTSRYTMDKATVWGRHQIGELADLVRAFRLPNGALGGGTDVVADVLILRKRTGERRRGFAWRAVTRDRFGYSNTVNEYWDGSPATVLGDMSAGRTSQHGLTIEVKARPGDAPAADQLADAAGAVAIEAQTRGLLWQAEPDPSAVFDAQSATTGDGWHEGSIRALDDGLYRVEGGRLEPVKRPTQELRALLDLRDLAVRLVGYEADHGMGDALIAPTRRATAAAYTAYVGRYGALNRYTTGTRLVEVKPGTELADDVADGIVEAATNAAGKLCAAYPVRRAPLMGGFRSDPDSALVYALEVFDDETGTAQPAPILTARQNLPVRQPTHTSDPRQALAWSLNHKGGVDLDYIAGRLRCDPDDVPGRLGDALYQDPQTLRWVTAEEYLSGDVRAKLAAAERAVTVHDRYTRNAEALREVLPTWLEPGEITANLGAAWIPAGDVERFIRETLRYRAVVKRVPETGQWEVDAYSGHRESPEASADWGTYDVDAYRLIELALNGKVPVVHRIVVIDGEERKRKDPDASMQASEKQNRLKERFSDWLWLDDERTDRLVHYYNTHFNCRVARRFDGSHITVDGLAPWFAAKAYPHQREYVARAIATPAALCGHPVGAGKTASMAMTAMKLRQLGLARKLMAVVPNHLIEQIDREFRQLLPGARIMSSSSATIAENRRAFNARCATQEWDIILVTHSAFDRMGLSPQMEMRYITDQMVELETAICNAAPEGQLTGRMVKGLAKRKDNLKTRLEDLKERAAGYDLGLTFESMGVDYVLIDEAHYYKNLAVPVRTDGFSVRPSKRATHLDMVLAYLAERGSGRYASLFTGTPVSNTMLELYVVLRYLMPDELRSMGLGSADAWAQTFVRFVTSVDVTVDGGQFQMVTRPSLFVNAPELRMLLSQVADVRTAEQLGLKRPQSVVDTIVCPRTRVQATYSAELVERAELVKNGGYGGGSDDDPYPNDNMLAICGDGRRMATDPALVGLTDPEDGKLAAVADNIAAIWRIDPTSLQLVFCDVGTPNAKKGAQTYGRLRRMLTDRGMPVGLIRFRHDAKTDGEVGQLFADCRVDGKVAVLMGSTDKMGVGTNVQRRVLAMHHVDAPWRPADVEQRDGRGVRPGNRYATIYIFRYVVERTFDAYTWQLLTRKIGFVSQVVSGKVDRTVEDVTADVVDAYAAIKAAAAGQPLLMEKATLEGEVKRLRSLQKGHRCMVERLGREIGKRRAETGSATREAEAWEALAVATGGDVDDLDDGETQRLHDFVKTFQRFYRYSNPELFAGCQVLLGTWRTKGERSETHPLVTVRGSADVDGLELRAYKFWTPQRLAEAFAGMLRKAPYEAQYLRDTIAENEAKNERAAQSAARPFTDADALTGALARLDQIQAELQQAALRNPEDEHVPAAELRTTRTGGVQVVATLADTGQPPAEVPVQLPPPVAVAVEPEPVPDLDVAGILGKLMSEFDTSTLDVLADLMAG